MKKIIFMLLALTALYGCSKMEQVPEQIPDDDSDLVIRLEGAINPVNPDSRAAEPVKPESDMDLVVLRAIAYATGDSPTYTDYSSSSEATLKKSGAIEWVTALKYPVDGRNTKLIGLYPRGEVVFDDEGETTVTYKGFDGTTDIMCSTEFLEGSKGNKITDKMIFDHILTQVQVYVQGESANTIDEWGLITGITISGRAGDVKVTVLDPTSSKPVWTPSNFSLTDEKSLTVSPLPGVDGSFGMNKVLYGVTMLLPIEDDELEFKVTTQWGGTKTLSTETIENYEGGKPYEITIKFKEGENISIDGGGAGDSGILSWASVEADAKETINADAD
jgi:hypothetical protein